MEEAGEVGREAEVRVGADAGENEEQGGGSVLAIERDLQLAAPFQSRELVPAGETRHVDYLPFELGSEVVGIQDGGGGGRHVGVAIRILVVLGSDRAP